MRLRVQDWEKLADAQLSASLAPEENTLEMPAPDDTGFVIINGLVPGQYEFRVHRGDYFYNGTLYGKVSVTVLAGTTTEITIPTTLGPPLELTVVKGRVIVAQGWTKKCRWVSCRGIDGDNRHIYELARVEEWDLHPPCTYRFTSKALPPGLYEVTVDPYSHKERVKVPVAGQLTLKVPSPARLRVRVVDPSGDHISTASVGWYSLKKWSRGGSVERSLFDPTDRAFIIVAPPGEISISVRAEGFSSVSSTATLFEGEQRDIKIQLGMVREIRVLIQVEGLHPPYAWVWGIKCKPLDHDTDMSRVSRGSGVSGAVMHASWTNVSAGRYRIVFPKAEGFKLIEPQTVEVSRLGLTTVSGALERLQ